MKINLKKLIKEEVQAALKEIDRDTFLNVDEDLTDSVMMVAVNEGDLYRAYKSGKITAEEAIRKAAQIYLKGEIDNLKDSLFNKEQLGHMTSTYKNYYKKEKAQPMF